MSISGSDIYNIDQSLTANGADELNLSSLTVKYLNNIPAQTISYLDATSSIQTQINAINGVTGPAGLAGPTGPMGPVGATGPSGINGNVGAPGATGATGATGTTGATGAGGISPTVSVGTTTTLSAFSSATVTNTGTSSALILNFAIPQGIQGEQGPQGDRGPKGDKGNTGNDGTSPGIGDIVSVVLSTIAYSSLQTQVSTLSGTITAIQGELLTVEAQITTLQAKTAFLSAVTTINGVNVTASRFTSDLLISNGISDRIALHQDGTSQFYGDMTIGQTSANNNLTVNGQVTTNEIVCQSAISFNNSVGLVGYGTNMLNIGTSLNNSVINIGGGTSIINLNGIVNSSNPFNFTGFVNQVGN